MKTGIVKIPEWAKEAFRSGSSLIVVDKFDMDSIVRNYDGGKVRMIDGFFESEHQFKNDQGEPFKIMRQWPESWIEIQEPEIDWSRVKVDAPIEASIEPNVFFCAHFAFNIENSIAFYKDGGTSHSCNEDYYRTTHKTSARFPQGVNPEDYYA